jgi:hypothetical protein
MEKLLNIEHLFHGKNSFKFIYIYIYIYIYLGVLLVLLESPFWVGYNKAIWEKSDLKCKGYWILRKISLKFQLNYKKWLGKDKLIG